jgi:hypothetical protein
MDRSALEAAAGTDAKVVTDPAALKALAQRYDAASFSFMRDTAFRDELRGWMRFQASDPNWARDGLNAAAMALSPLEATKSIKSPASSCFIVSATKAHLKAGDTSIGSG